MRIVCVGGGPGGLYFAVLMKKADPRHHITVLERNRPDDTFGFGVVFSDATMAAVAGADAATYGDIAQHLVHWDDIEVNYRGERITSTGHGFSGVSRHTLLRVLQEQARAAGVEVQYEREVATLDACAGADLVVGCDGANSTIRRLLDGVVRTAVDARPNRFVWLGTSKPFPAFTFYFKQTEHGLWRVHAYQYEPGRSTFIVECRENTWRAAGLEQAREHETAAFLERLFAEELEGHALTTNRSVWRQFPTIRTEPWSAGHVVLLGDAAHTAHFSVGSGTRMAMEDAIALRDALVEQGACDPASTDPNARRSASPQPRSQSTASAELHAGSSGSAEPQESSPASLGTEAQSAKVAAGPASATTRDRIAAALRQYELRRRPVVESLQRAAQASLQWFEDTERYLSLEPLQFTFALLTRSLRITHEDLRVRDPGFLARVDEWVARESERQVGGRHTGAVPERHADAVRAHEDPRPREVPRELERGAQPDRSVRLQPDRSVQLQPDRGGASQPEDEVQQPDRGVRRRLDRRVRLQPDLAPPPMFTPFRLRDLVLANRVVVSPMCQYVAEDGAIGDWHLVHLGSRAMGGAGLVMAEMTDVSREARISPWCAGLYKPEHAARWKRIVEFVHRETPAAIGVQLGHAGRKGATRRLWEGDNEPLPAGGWPIVSASPIPYFPDRSPVPREMTEADMAAAVADFARATELASEAGFDLLEIHMAHGYLLASFISPLTNTRTDEYGGSLQQRMRFPLRVFDACREVWPAERPMSARISAVDWSPGGMEPEDAVEVARLLEAHGCDIVDVSAGQTVADQQPVYGRLFQTPFADRVRHEVGIATMAVGNISSYMDVNTIVAAGRADLCVLARAHLFDPYWTRHAAWMLGYPLPWPDPYKSVERYTPRFEFRFTGDKS